MMCFNTKIEMFLNYAPFEKMYDWLHDSAVIQTSCCACLHGGKIHYPFRARLIKDKKGGRYGGRGGVRHF